MADKVGAPRGDIHLQKDATETAVKRADLADYPVVYFVTQGLLAREVEGWVSPFQPRLTNAAAIASKIISDEITPDGLAMMAVYRDVRQPMQRRVRGG